MAVLCRRKIILELPSLMILQTSLRLLQPLSVVETTAPASHGFAPESHSLQRAHKGRPQPKERYKICGGLSMNVHRDLLLAPRCPRNHTFARFHHVFAVVSETLRATAISLSVSPSKNLRWTTLLICGSILFNRSRTSCRAKRSSRLPPPAGSRIPSSGSICAWPPRF